MSGLLFDFLLAAGLLWLGWSTICGTSLLRAIVAFIAFGLLMALCWARLRAPDVALAEAAIGAGLAGALLLDAYRVFRNSDRSHRLAAIFTLDNAWLMVLAIYLAAGLVAAILSLDPAAVGLNAVTYERLPETGVSNPVTAVLLNYRGYDTLLEVAVLIMALIGIWAAGTDRTDARYSRAASAEESLLLEALVRLVLPLAVLTAGYLLWSGAHAPGGAFQAGAVLAAAGVLLRLTEHLRPHADPSWGVRLMASLGCLVFIGVALQAMLHGGYLLQYPQELAGALILVIESALTVAIGLILTLLFVGSPGLKRRAW